jgi:anti-sigma regulatory factor (Ser/Thr protein kinase)
MTIQTTTPHTHEVVLYESDDEYLDIVVPFLMDGMAEHQPTFVGCGPANSALIHAALGTPPGLTHLAMGWDAGPAAVVKRWREMLDELVAGGATQIRAVGDVPHPGYGVPWEWWGRYEAVANHAFADYPLWGVCTYDLRITPDDVLDEVLRTHRYSTSGSCWHEPNPLFEDPASFLRSRTVTYRDPLETTVPFLELNDPDPAASRAATRSVCAAAGLTEDDTEGMLVAVSEVIANAIEHGNTPCQLRLWAGEQRALAIVADTGSGPHDPFIGMLPPQLDAPTGRGLWIAHQLCSQVSMEAGHDGFSVRLVAGGRRHSSEWS